MIDDQPTSKSGRKDPDSSWSPVVMSVVVYPGIGQFMQKRFGWGTVYAITFTLMGIIFVKIFHTYIMEVIPVFQRALLGELSEPATIPPIKNLIQPLAALLIIYFGNVVDVLRGRIFIIKQLKP